MDIDTARVAFAEGALTEVILEPAEAGNGWMILIRKQDGATEKLTDHQGLEKIYHSIDRATDAAKAIGFGSVRVEERF